MNQIVFCPECGTQISSDAPDGLCPYCLLRVALERPDSHEDAEENCPSEQQLRRLVEGSLPEPDAKPVREHVEVCPACLVRSQAIRDSAGPGAIGSELGPTVVEPPNAIAPRLKAPAEPTGINKSSHLPSDSIPGYEILKEVHRGGQGVVYQAIQKATKRRVAIKVMREGPFAGPHDRSRFEREVQILAALQHPHIVSVHDSGVASGNFYFTMDYISGDALDRHVEQRNLSVNDILRLFAKVCEAVNAAHLRGVIHRDLKPANIRVDAEGEPHILDFGLARVALGGLTEGSRPQVMTLTGEFIGSPPWSAPEQADGSPHLIDVRTDVYALGVILFQILTGRFPYDVTGNLTDVLERVRRADPVKPSTLRRDIGDEVETIILKCLSKDRERRYQSAGELARDIHHYLAGEPIEAKRDSTLYVLRKTLRRHRVPVAVATAFVLLLSVSLVVSVSLWYQAQQNFRKAEQGRKVAEEAHKIADAKSLEAEAARRQAEEREKLAQRRLYTRQIALAQQALNTNSGPLRKLLLECPEKLRGWEWYWLWNMSDCSRLVLRGHTESVVGALYSPDGRSVVSIGYDGYLRVWDADTGEESRGLRIESNTLQGFGVDPAWSRVLVGMFNDTPQLWDLVQGRKLWSLPWTDIVYRAAFSLDGNRIALAGANPTVTVCDAATGADLLKLEGHEDRVNDVVFSPDGSRVATASWDSTVRVWDATSGKVLAVLRGHESAVYGVAYSPDGRWVVSGGGDQTVRLWDANTGEALRTFRGHSMAVNGVAVSPDSRLVASAGRDATVRIWEADSGKELALLRGHGASVVTVAFRPDGREIISASRDHTIRMWPLEGSKAAQVLGVGEGDFQGVDFSPDGRQLVAAGTKTLIWDVQKGREVETGYSGKATDAVQISPDGTLVLISKPDLEYGGVLEVRNATSDAELWRAPSFNDDDTALFSPDGREIAYTQTMTSVAVCEATSGSNRLLLQRPEGTIWSIAFNPKGTRVAAGGDGKGVMVWDVATGQAISTFRDHTQSVEHVAFSPDARVLASSGGGTVRFSDPETGRELRPPWEHFVHGFAFSPDGTRLVTSDIDVSIWDVATGDLLLNFGGIPQTMYRCVEFSPDGRCIAAANGMGAGRSGCVFLWETSNPK